MNRVDIKRGLVFFAIISFMMVGCGKDRAGALDDNSSKGSTIIAGVSHLGEDDPIDTDGDGLIDEYEREHGLNPFNTDTDEDGLSDAYEMSHDEVNATNPDTDGDKLLDGEEVNEYDTEPNNPDTDSDGLDDYDEVKTHGTDPNESDTDGDCLLDSFEVLNYETNATVKDTDGDKIDDGIEIYSYGTDELNTTCLDTPETIAQGYNSNPAIDGIPDKASDIINALDPTNDSDGDGQSNIKENNCTEGDPKDKDKMCPFIHETEEGKILTEHGYSYVPGGFDVDGDGIDEGGFWMSRYQARSSGISISREEVIEEVGNVNKYISKHFKVLNRTVEVTSYNEALLDEATTPSGSHLVFDINSSKPRISSFTPYLAQVCLTKYQLKDSKGIELDINITMPTLKQYMQVKMLLDADMANNGDGRHIRNGLLGIDNNAPLLVDYNLIIDEFGETKKEFVRNLIQIIDIHGDRTFDIKDAPDWWGIEITKFESSNSGANSTQDLGSGSDIAVDPYAVVVRGGSSLDIRYGVSGKSDTISFRAATPYLY